MCKRSFIIVLIFFLLSFRSYAGGIKDYKYFTAVCYLKKGEQALVALRKYRTGNIEYYYLVNPETLLTSVRPADELRVIYYPFEIIREKYRDTVYFKALRDAELNSEKLQDAGITHFLPFLRGINLTVDLCPSKLPLDNDFFLELIREMDKIQKPVPIAIAVTGLWLERHEKDLKWLLELEKEKKLAINWINHSYSHFYDKGLPLAENFLLKTGIDINYEILQTEIKLLESGIVPSIFFRFPGLVSKPGLFYEVTGYGLIPIGSDAWLAKNELPKNGSIILVHANGNEPVGTSKFLKLLSQEKEKILSKEWMLYDLRESLIKLEK